MLEEKAFGCIEYFYDRLTIWFYLLFCCFFAITYVIY